jgi:gamma-glutamyltranspeptidase/glutathione hydrolase
MQAQGIAQVLLNVLDLGANVQAATDMARFRHLQVPNLLRMESPLFARVGTALRAMGHDVRSVNGDSVGGYQAIMFTPDADAPSTPGGPIRGFYRAGSDHRKDGGAVGF